MRFKDYFYKWFGGETRFHPSHPQTLPGFWIRVLSDIFDAAILAAAGHALGRSFTDFFGSMGDSAVWLGLALAFAYHGILHSGLGGGQTLAKRLLNLQVVARDGSFLRPERALLRYLPVAMAFYGGKAASALTLVFPPLFAPWFEPVWAAAIVCVAALLLAPMLFHPLKRGLQDSLADSLVVRKGKFDADALMALEQSSGARRATWAVVGVFVGVMVAATFLVRNDARSWPARAELYDVAAAIESQTAFRSAMVFPIEVTRTRLGGTERTERILQVHALLNPADYHNDQALEEESHAAAHAAVERYSGMAGIDVISVQARTGYNLGIAASFQRRTLLFSPDGEPLEFEDPQTEKWVHMLQWDSNGV